MHVDYEGLTFERLGHASVRIETDGGQVVYIDPWSEVFEGDPGDADVVFVTHDDFDHYDPEAIDAVSTDETTVVAYADIDTADLDRDVTTVGENEETSVAGIGVRTVPAYNRSDGEHVDDEGNPFHAQGEVVGLLLDFEGTTVYFPSDTDFLDEHTDIRADVFIPPIGGHYTMGRDEAVRFTESVDPDLVLPVHYDTFEPIETDATAFESDLEAKGYEVVLF